MTKQDLEQIYNFTRELRMWERELEILRGRSLAASPLPQNSRGSGISDKVAARAEKTLELERRISEKREQLQDARDRAVEYISGIPDSLTRQIVYYRCVSLMSWKRVAYEVGGRNTPDSVRMVYNRFFERLE